MGRDLQALHWGLGFIRDSAVARHRVAACRRRRRLHRAAACRARRRAAAANTRQAHHRARHRRREAARAVPRHRAAGLWAVTVSSGMFCATVAAPSPRPRQVNQLCQP